MSDTGEKSSSSKMAESGAAECQPTVSEQMSERRELVRDPQVDDILSRTGHPDCKCQLETYYDMFIVKLQALLNQFAHPKVRADFVNNQFDWRVNSSLLPLIDNLRCLLFPRWNDTSSLNTFVPRDDDSRKNLKLLYYEHESYLRFENQDQLPIMTYKTLYEFLDILANDKYWNYCKADERCLHIQSDNSENKYQRRHKIKPVAISSSSSSESETKKAVKPKPKKKLSKSTIIISSDESDVSFFNIFLRQHNYQEEGQQRNCYSSKV